MLHTNMSRFVNCSHCRLVKGKWRVAEVMCNAISVRVCSLRKTLAWGKKRRTKRIPDWIHVRPFAYFESHERLYLRNLFMFIKRLSSEDKHPLWVSYRQATSKCVERPFGSSTNDWAFRVSYEMMRSLYDCKSRKQNRQMTSVVRSVAASEYFLTEAVQGNVQ